MGQSCSPKEFKILLNFTHYLFFIINKFESSSLYITYLSSFNNFHLLISVHRKCEEVNKKATVELAKNMKKLIFISFRVRGPT